MIDPGHPRLSMVRQCELASISCSSFYREPTADNGETLRLMRLIDEQFLETPWYGSRQMARHLRRNGWCVASSRPSSDAQDGFGADLPAPEDERATSEAQDLSVSAAASDHRSAEPSLVPRRDLHPDAQRLPVPGRDHGLIHPKGSSVEAMTSVSRRWRKPLPASADLRSSTPTKARSSPALPSPIP
jgi:hypothetical protein